MKNIPSYTFIDDRFGSYDLQRLNKISHTRCRRSKNKPQPLTVDKELSSLTDLLNAMRQHQVTDNTDTEATTAFSFAKYNSIDDCLLDKHLRSLKQKLSSAAGTK
ncbi:MAG: hypothetical protein D8B59_08425 [Bacteroidetes bacterium]|jgi:hypothetical protein|nr:MAG: hypothetical protein D8B59_08425 [Bacteroidota bacterium]